MGSDISGAQAAATFYWNVMPETYWLMSQLAFASVWLVMVFPWTVRFLKWTPSMFTVDDLPCRLITFLTSELTFVK